LTKTEGLSHLTIHTQGGNDKMLKAVTKNAFKIVENLPNYYGEEKNA
jgi:acetolactate synthase small subunit